jgi:hypothetical protein
VVEGGIAQGKIDDTDLDVRGSDWLIDQFFDLTP